MSNLHIIICSNLDKSNGGCEVWLDYFLREISQRKVYSKIHLYHVKGDNVRMKELKRHNIESIACPPYCNGIMQVLVYTCVSLVYLLKNVMQNDRVIYIGSTFVALIGIIFGCFQKVFKTKSSMVTWIRSIAVQELKLRSPKIWPLAYLMERVMLVLSDKVIMNGNDTYNYYAEKYNIAYKSAVVENAVPDNSFFFVPMLDCKKEKLDIAFMGRYSPAKGFDIYLDSVGREFCDNIVFHSYGHGPLKKNINDEFVVDHDKYTPNEVNDILKHVDVVVFLNKSGIAAGVSHSLLETMAAGRGIVAWNNSIHNQVCNNDMAFLVKENDIESLKKIYTYLSKNREDLVRKAENARKRAKKFTITNHVNMFLNVLENNE